MVSRKLLIQTAGLLACSLFRKIWKAKCKARKKKRRPRRYKVRPLNRNREKKSFFYVRFLPMKANDPYKFYEYTRMTVQLFHKLLTMIEPRLTKTEFGNPICEEERLAVTIQ